MINPMDLAGKHILITGASSGIGRATAIQCSCMGAHLSLVARRKDQLDETLALLSGSGHSVYPCDLSLIETIAPLFAQIVAERGALDGFVHCAGGGVNRPLSLIKNEYITDLMRINFFAFAEFMRIIGKKRFSNEGASVVGISSVAAFQGDKAQGAYAASKGAINSFIHSAAKELSIRKIRVNSVAFGMVCTEQFQSFLDNGGSTDSLYSQYLGLGTLDDAANIISFLLSPASKFITGTVLVADGGYLS